MASSVVCSWLMAACMSVACENESSNSISIKSSNLSLSSRFTKWAARKRKRVLPISKCNPEISTIRHLMSSCLSFEPCDNFYKATSSPFFSGNSGTPSFSRRRNNKLRQPAHSGIFIFIFIFHLVCFLIFLLVFLCMFRLIISDIHGKFIYVSFFSYLFVFFFFLIFWIWDLGQALRVSFG